MQKLGGAEVFSQVPSQSNPAKQHLCGNINPSNWLNKRRANHREPNTLMTPMIASILNLMGPDMIVILLIVLLLFGAKKLPELARGMGRAVREFSAARDEIERELSQSNTGAIEQPKFPDTRVELPSARQS